MCNFCSDNNCLSVKECKTLATTICKNCSGMGHTTRMCPTRMCLNKMVCNFCGGDHTQNNCAKLSEVTCLTCKQKGHTSRFCKTKFCRICKSNDHSTEECKHYQADYAPICYFCKTKGHKVTECETLKHTVCPKCKGVGHVEKWCKFEPSAVRVMKNTFDVLDLDKDFPDALNQVVVKKSAEWNIVDEQALNDESFQKLKEEFDSKGKSWGDDAWDD